MVKIGTAWDRTTEVLAGRGGMLAGIAALTFVLPSAIRAALQLLVVPTTNSLGLRALVALVSMLAALVTIYGQLALVAAASDPATRSGDAYAIARARFFPAIGLYLVLAIGFVVALIPIGVAIGMSGVDIAAPDLATAIAATPGGILAFLALYMLAYVVVAIYVSARLFTLNPVLVNERLGLASYARTFALTRGSVWRIIGTIVLLGIVLLVALSAVQAVVALLFRLILGANEVGIALFLAAVAGSIVSAAYAVVMATLTTQFYLLARAEAGPSDVRPAH